MTLLLPKLAQRMLLVDPPSTAKATNCREEHRVDAKVFSLIFEGLF
jgi:hypothetical protein